MVRVRVTCLAMVSWLIPPTSFLLLPKLRLGHCVCIPAISAVQFLVSRFAASFRQEAHRVLSAWSGILFQYGPHVILLVNMFLMWSLRRGGTPRAFIPVRSFLFVGLRPVACCILLVFGTFQVSCCRMGGVFLVFHFRISLYVWWASSACSLAPS